MRFQTISVLAFAAAMSFGAAQAATISINSVSGKWTSATPDTTTGLTGVGTSEIRWGTPFGGNSQSGYKFVGIAPSGPHDEGVAFDIGTFTHFNFPIVSGTSITGATLEVSFVIAFEDSSTETITSVYDFDHWETPNNASPCADGGTNGSGVNVNGCADRVIALTNLGSSQSFDIGGVEYILDVTGFLVNGTPLTQFWTVEGETNVAKLQAKFTTKSGEPPPPPPVPLPAAGWLMLAGVGGLAAARSRRRSA